MLKMVRIARCAAGLGLACVVVACSTGTTKEEQKVQGAVTTPLADLNLVRVPIPPLLQQAQKEPYRVPEDSSCAALVAEDTQLDAILGNDIDAPAKEPDKYSAEHAQSVAGDAAIGALRRTAEGVVPFRSWVRKLTGAERHSREVDVAISAGTARRAFLKGLRVGRGCESK